MGVALYGMETPVENGTGVSVVEITGVPASAVRGK
jgi:hypothetical protein